MQIALSVIRVTLILEEHAICNSVKDLNNKNFILLVQHLLQSHRNVDPLARKELAVPIELILVT